MNDAKMTLKVDGQRYALTIPVSTYLLDALRSGLGLLGTKEACDEGECGSCTVLVDGQAIDSCIYLAAQAVGREITTIAGLSEGPELNPLQRAFVDSGAIQCGFCTPGFVMAATELLRRSPSPSDAEIRTALAGNLCRCTGYNNIVAAVRTAATEIAHERTGK
jgi:aerobic-type carbon monoxide dehydrogenase small subunit (CoxS/CutS family)